MYSGKGFVQPSVVLLYYVEYTVVYREGECAMRVLSIHTYQFLRR